MNCQPPNIILKLFFSLALTDLSYVILNDNPHFNSVTNLALQKITLLVLLQISKSCKRTNSGGFVKKSVDSDSVSDGTEWQAHLDMLSYTPVTPSATHVVSQSLCKHVKSSKTYLSLTPGQTVFTLDDNRKFDYGIFIVCLQSLSNTVSHQSLCSLHLPRMPLAVYLLVWFACVVLLH